MGTKDECRCWKSTMAEDHSEPENSVRPLGD